MDEAGCLLAKKNMEGFGVRMKVNYFRERKEHHMVIAAGEYLCPAYQFNMMKENPVQGLFVPVVRQMNGELLYDYSITGCQSLQTYTELSPISGQVLAVLVKTLNQVLEEMERYLVDGEYLALRPEFIYLNVKGEAVQQVNFCFFPFCAQMVEEQTKELLKYVLNEVDYQEKTAVNLAYELFQQSLQEDFLIRQLNQLVEEGLPDWEEAKKTEILSAGAVELMVQESPYEEIRKVDCGGLIEERKSDGQKSKKRLLQGRISKREREIVLSDILK